MDIADIFDHPSEQVVSSACQKMSHLSLFAYLSIHIESKGLPIRISMCRMPRSALCRG
jgi:hypothetical protein